MTPAQIQTRYKIDAGPRRVSGLTAGSVPGAVGCAALRAGTLGADGEAACGHVEQDLTHAHSLTDLRHTVLRTHTSSETLNLLCQFNSICGYARSQPHRLWQDCVTHADILTQFQYYLSMNYVVLTTLEKLCR
jgi:hypothetical protein